MDVDSFYTLVLASNINGDGTKDFDILRYDHEAGAGAPGDGHGSLMDKYDYVMHGKIFKYSINNQRITIFISFGGLLMSITGGQSELKSLEIDSRIFLLLKKI
ncbi:hypothetical protein FGO68_gene17793 [Halteria grandinella]|nr:hypothetical protein FGO68_gene17793 [Halteria grandinella]